MNLPLPAPAARPASLVDNHCLLPVSLVSPSLHASLILPPGRKGIAILGAHRPVIEADGTEEWRWQSIGADASEIEAAVAAFRPSFVTLNAFTKKARRGNDDFRTHPCKRVANLASYGAVWVDLDHYRKPAWQHATEDGIVWEIRDRLARAGRAGNAIPDPSYIVRSGSGFHVVWLLEAVPLKARKAWTALQAILNDLFVDMGRDTAVMPASANLRLVGTLNGGEPVRIVWPNLVGEIHRHSFRTLCRAAFPFTPEQVATYRVEQAAAKAARKAAAVSRVRSGQSPVLTGESYYRTLQRDVEVLCRGRFPHGVPKGERNAWLLALAKVWAWTAGPKALRQRIAEWAPHLGLQVATALTQAGTVIRRAEAQDHSDASLGRRGRYPVGPKKLAVELGVTVAEARRFDLRMMIPTSMKRDRAAERQEKSRRARGVQPLDGIRDARLAVGQQALALMAEGLARAAVMERLGVKKSYLDKALAEARAVAATVSPTAKRPVPAPAQAVPEALSEPTAEAVPEPSRDVSRYIARASEAVTALEACASSPYHGAVHDVAAPQTNPRPVAPPGAGGSSRFGTGDAARAPVLPAFVARLRGTA